MPNVLQVEFFREIARFPAITLPVLEMTSNEIAHVLRAAVNFHWKSLFHCQSRVLAGV